MRYQIKSMLDLNEENISNIFKFCLATHNENPDDIISVSFLDKEVNVPVPEMKFLKSHLDEKSEAIHYMVCQLECIHNKKLDMLLDDGFKKYGNRLWTNNKAMVFSLYYLACSIGAIKKFKVVSRLNTFASDLGLEFFLKPTLSPYDPDFEKWKNDFIK